MICCSLIFHRGLLTRRLEIRRGAKIDVGEHDGIYELNHAKNTIDWHLGQIDSSSLSGSLEFRANTDDTSAFYPVNVNFTSPSSFCDVKVGYQRVHIENTPDFVLTRPFCRFSVSWTTLEILATFQAHIRLQRSRMQSSKFPLFSCIPSVVHFCSCK